jgi:hypothetical protein
MSFHLRRGAFILTVILVIILFAGCAAMKFKEEIPAAFPKIPELTREQITEFIDKYKFSNDLEVTDKTLEILSAQDTWPDKMFEFVLLLPAERIPDKIYQKLARMFLLELGDEQVIKFLELCFDIDEINSNNHGIISKQNQAKFDKIIWNMENFLLENKYAMMEPLYRYVLFVSIKYIYPSPVYDKNNTWTLTIAEDDMAYISYLPEKIDDAGIPFSSDIYTEGRAPEIVSIQKYKIPDDDVDRKITIIPSVIVSYFTFGSWKINKTQHLIRIFKPTDNVSKLRLLLSYISSEEASMALRNGKNVTEFYKWNAKHDYEECFENICEDLHLLWSQSIYSEEQIKFLNIVFPTEKTAEALKSYNLTLNEAMNVLMNPELAGKYYQNIELAKNELSMYEWDGIFKPITDDAFTTGQ